VNYKSIELFAGAGGMAIGFEQAGFEIQLAIDNDKDCVATLLKNRPNWNIIKSNAEDINYKQFNGQIDVVTGGFPCQSFSHAGKRLGFEDTRGTAFYGLAKAINEIKPKVFVGENVKGLSTHDKGFTLQTILNVFGKLGYNVKYRVLNALHYRVPQKRERTIIIGIKNDIIHPEKYEFPTPSDRIITLREAFTRIPDSQGSTYSEARSEVLKLVPEGGNWRDLPIDVAKNYMKKTYGNGGGNTGVAKRLSWNEPSPTLMCSPIQKTTERCHPIETRPLTIRESARIQTFPDDWEFTGTIASQYKQIGNAVPVRMARAIAISIKNFLNECNLS
jgi:DNA (cytosine-5)-methyltransferase 1